MLHHYLDQDTPQNSITVQLHHYSPVIFHQTYLPSFHFFLHRKMPPLVLYLGLGIKLDKNQAFFLLPTPSHAVKPTQSHRDTAAPPAASSHPAPQQPIPQRSGQAKATKPVFQVSEQFSRLQIKKLDRVTQRD